MAQAIRVDACLVHGDQRMTLSLFEYATTLTFYQLITVNCKVFKITIQIAYIISTNKTHMNHQIIAQSSQ